MSTKPAAAHYSGIDYTPGDVIAIVDNRNSNVTSQNIYGLDMSGSYKFHLKNSSLEISGSGSWLHSEQKNTPSSPIIALAGTVYNPAHWRGRAGAIWKGGSLTVASFVNYIGGVEDTVSVPNVSGGSMTTGDLTLTYSIKSDNQFNGIDLTISVQNITNEGPPFLKNTRATYVNYDSTNYSSVGRFVSFTVSKKF